MWEILTTLRLLYLRLRSNKDEIKSNQKLIIAMIYLRNSYNLKLIHLLLLRSVDKL